MKIRVSIATASLLGLKNYIVAAQPTTLYFMLPGECKGQCLYCTHREGYLSRVKWPEFDMEEVIKAIKRKEVKRICIQCPYGDNVDAIEEVAKKLRDFAPISASITAMSREEMERLKKAGIERVGIGLDCASQRIFKKWKKNTPSWKEYIDAIENAKDIFGSVTCHLIIGLGESDEEAINLMQKMAAKGVKIALFAFFKEGKNLVPLPRYRIMQIARYAIENGGAKFSFDNGKLIEMEVKRITKEAFLTSGCPNCNRPFYNERVTKIYNYPYLPSDNEFEQAVKEAEKYGRIYIASE